MKRKYYKFEELVEIEECACKTEILKIYDFLIEIFDTENLQLPIDNT